MDSALRPRDIQARIRAGETPEIVAQAAQTSLERVMPFAVPVLAERAHVAERAQRSSLRRNSEHPGARTLGEAVAERLRRIDVDPQAVTWDAWRRDDGRWALTATYTSEARSGTGHFAFDPPGNYVVTEDDEARWLVGEGADPQPVPVPGGQPRRLTAVGDADLTLGDDALGLFLDDPVPDGPVPDGPAPDGPAAEEQVAGRAAEDEASTVDLTETAARVRQAETEEAAAAAPETAPAPPARRPVRKTRGRASVPSWDEIMFGGSVAD